MTKEKIKETAEKLTYDQYTAMADSAEKRQPDAGTGIGYAAEDPLYASCYGDSPCGDAARDEGWEVLDEWQAAGMLRPDNTVLAFDPSDGTVHVVRDSGGPVDLDITVEVIKFSLDRGKNLRDADEDEIKFLRELVEEHPSTCFLSSDEMTAEQAEWDEDDSEKNEDFGAAPYWASGDGVCTALFDIDDVLNFHDSYVVE